MVVEPSENVFNDVMSKVTTLPSYTGGDQGFLNSYYSDFPNAHVFKPNIPLEVVKLKPAPEMQQLSTLYNADVGLYMLANKWMVDENELCIIHYTLGPLKPWDWWTLWLLKPVDVWRNVREQLADTLPGTRGGRNPNDELVVKFLLFIPLFNLLLCCYHSSLQIRKHLGSFCRSSFFDHIRHLSYIVRYNGALYSSSINSDHQSKVPVYLGGISILVCFISAVVSIGLALAIVPRQVMLWTGLLLMYEWTFTIFSLLFGAFLHVTCRWGKTVSVQVGSYSSDRESLDYDSGKGHQRQASYSCDIATWYYGLGIAFLSFAAPSLPFVFGITALFPRLGLMVAGGLVLASFMTYAAEHLAIRSFLRGLEDREATRPRSMCSFC